MWHAINLCHRDGATIGKLIAADLAVAKNAGTPVQIAGVPESERDMQAPRERGIQAPRAHAVERK